jgi:capsular polysaccharide biosynthesis protein
MSSNEEYSLWKHWVVLKANRKWILTCTLVAGLSAGLISFLQPRIFGAKTLILVSESRIGNADAKVSSLMFYELLRTYKTLLFNDSVIEKTIEKFKLKEPPYDLSVERFRRDGLLQVSLQKNTPLLEVNVEFPDARLAADMANFLATQAISLSEEISAADHERAVLVAQTEMKRALQDLETSNKRLAEFNKMSRIETTREWVRNLIERIAEEETNLTALKIKLAVCQSERQALSDRLKIQPFKSEPNDANLVGRPSEVSLANNSDQSSQPASPQKEEASRLPQHLQDPMLETSSQVVSLTAEIGAIQAVLRENTRKLDQFIQDKAVNEGVLSQLSLENELCTENYVALSKKFREASMSVADRTIDLRQISPALRSVRPVKPRIPLNILLGAAFGFLASTFAILLLQGVLVRKKMKEDHHNAEQLRKVQWSSKT